LASSLRGVQAVITGGYWLKPLTANRLAVIFILPTATANRLGGGDYFYNRRLAVITSGLKPLSNFGFGPGLDRFWVGLKSVFGYFYTCLEPFFVQIFQEKNLILFGPFVLCYKITNPNIF
jgi:hypothetical protein